MAMDFRRRNTGGEQAKTEPAAKKDAPKAKRRGNGAESGGAAGRGRAQRGGAKGKANGIGGNNVNGNNVNGNIGFDGVDGPDDMLRMAPDDGYLIESGKGRGRGKGSGGPMLEIIPIGGLGEIGKNFTAFRYENEILLIDCGMSFPDDGMPGIDVVIPDFTFIDKHRGQIKGLVVTHGHEDHIGGVPYLLKRVNIPVYGTSLTLALINHKLEEHGMKADFHHVKAGSHIKIGTAFRIETIRATHSVADSLSLCIETPVGRVFHTGDFKIDYTPIDGDPMDFQRLAEIGKKGVDLMLCDSTNALRPGFSKSEKTMGPILDSIFAETKGRIIIATFASNVHRVQTIINTAVHHKRKIALSGRSMLNVMGMADSLGYLDIPKGSMIDLEDIADVSDKKLVIITTGSQGEPMSALSRMAAGEHKSVKIRRGDTVILSSSPIPGNEKTISGTINSLLGLGADVIYSDIADIHVSGHASREEIKIMLSLLTPSFYMPVHGENKHLLQNASIAEEMGIARDHIVVARNGYVVEMRAGAVKASDRRVPAEPVFVDGLGVGDIGTSVLRDRKQLSESGLIIVTAVFDAASGYLVSGPEVISRGFVYEKQSGDIIEDLRREATYVIEDFEAQGHGDDEALKAALRQRLKALILERTKRYPMILPIILES